MTQLHIGFDTSHKERGKLDSNYRGLQQVLQDAGFGCWEFSSFPITRESLQNYDIMVFACTDSSKYSPGEIEAIADWVKEGGGGLLLLSHAGGDKGRRTNLTELSSQFGMIFENDQVLDEMNNYGIENMPNITTFPMPHPIIEGITSICFRAGCSVSPVGFVQPVAMGGDTTIPGNATVIAAAEQGEGKVVCSGSYEIFRDEIAGGITQAGHAALARNLFEFLRTSKRIQLREGAAAAMTRGDSSARSLDTADSLDAGGDSLVPATEISSIHDLFDEMKTILKEMDVLRSRVVNVYNVIAALDGSAAGQEETPETPVTGPTTTSGIDANPSPPTQDELMALIQQKKPPKDAGSTSFSSPPPAPPAQAAPASLSSFLSELKSEQAHMSNGERRVDLDELEIKQPGLGTVVEDTTEPASMQGPVIKKYSPSADDKRKSRNELEDEIEKLEAKVKSVDNLKNFIERKFKDGKITEEEFTKEHAKYETDIETTRQKIEVYKELLAGK